MHSNTFYFKIVQFIFLTFLVFFISTNTSFSQSTSWKGTVSTAWSTAGNWTNGIPSASLDAIIGDASFTSSNNPTITGTANCKSLTIGGSVASVLTVTKTLNINGNLTINANGKLAQGAISVNITGNWSNSGIYAGDSLLVASVMTYAIVNFSGTSQTISGSALTSFLKPTINSGSTVTLSSDIKVLNTLTVPGTLNPGEPVKKVLGDMPISVGVTGTLKVTASSVAGNYSASAISLSTGSTVDYSSTTVAQTISNSYTYTTLRISGSGIKTLGGVLVSLKSTSATFGNIYVVSGTLDLSTYSANRGTSVVGGSLSVSAGATLKVGGVRTLPLNYATYSFDPASTVEYAGTAQPVAAQTYGHLILSSSSGAAVKTMPGTAFTIAGNFNSQVGLGTSVSFTSAADITFSGSVNIGAGTTFNAASYSYSVAGNWVNNGVFTGTSSTITMSGTSATISGTGTHSFYSLIISGSGITASARVITVAGNLLTTGSGIFTHASGGILTLSGTNKTISTKGIMLDTLVVAGTTAFNNATTSSNVSAVTTEINNITISAASLFTVDNETLKIKKALKTNGGEINATNGKIELFGTTAQSIPSAIFTSNIVKDLVISNVAGVTLNGTINLTGTVLFGNVDNSFINTNSNLTLVSTATATANVGDLTNGGANTGNKINGLVTVERYFTAKRAYRFLTTPVITTGSIRTNWMENTNNPSTSVNNNPVPNYGTQVSGVGGNANGFDETVLNNSTLFTFSNSGQAWAAVPNTTGLLTAGTAYRILIRGSRSTDLNNNAAPPSITTLRTKGTLLDGTLVMKKAGGGGTAGMPELSSLTNGFSFIGNPYASPVDWTSLEKTDVSSTIYIFDPTVSGTNGRGAYVSYNTTEGTNNNGESFIDENIQSGQAFFILSTGPNPSLTFQETHKTAAFNPVFRTANTYANVAVQLLLPSQVNSGGAADGCKVFFSDNFSAALGDEDSYKFSNLDENIAIVRAGKTLSIEGRKTVTANDTVPLKIWQLLQNNYTFKINSSGFAPNVTGYLEDAFLHTSTTLTANGETMVPFNITTNAASFAPDRFRIVFKVSAPPISGLTNTGAIVKGGQVDIHWSKTTDKNVDRYEVEKSTDLKKFTLAASVVAGNGSEAIAAYRTTDPNPAEGENYYRIKTISTGGEIKTSPLLKVRYEADKSNISAAGNEDEINLVFKNMEKGKYGVRLFSSNAQLAGDMVIDHNGGTAHHSMTLKNHLPAGIYTVQVNNDHVVKAASLFIINQRPSE